MSCRRETLLRDYSVSIEPLSTNGDTLGAAFFGKPRNEEDDDFDPSMCSFELAIHTATVPNKKLSPTKNDTGLSRRFMTPSVKDKTETKELSLYCCVDGAVYQIDVEQIQNVKSELNHDGETSAKPPCLLIQFMACNFRIFTVSGLQSDQIAALNGVKTRLIDYLTSGNLTPFPVSSSVMTSPNGNNTPLSSNEPAQKDTPPRSEQEEGSSSSECTSEKESNGNSIDSSEMILKQCQQAYSKAQVDLQTLEYALSLPSISKEEFKTLQKERVCTLLTSIPDGISESFCTHVQLTQAVQTQNRRINDHHLEMDGILKSFWPNLRSNKRSRNGDCRGERRLSAADRRPQLPSDECIAKTNEIMKQHKETLMAKYSLSLLPNRGGY